MQPAQTDLEKENTEITKEVDLMADELVNGYSALATATQKYHKELNSIKQEIFQIHNGTHAKIIDFDASLAERKQEKIWVAELWRKYQLETIEKLYYTEKQQGELEYESQKINLKEKLLQDFIDKKKDLEDTSENETESEVERSQKRPNRRKEQERNKRSKQTSKVISNTLLNDADILSDLAIISKDLNLKRKGKSQILVDVFFVDEKLFCNGNYFEKGEKVNLSGAESLNGEISNINNSEIVLNSKTKILLVHLRSGKYILEKLAIPNILEK